MILGATGVVGSHLKRELEKAHEIITVARSSANVSHKIDVADHAALEGLIKAALPDVVINSVKPPLSTDEMEKQQELTYDINARLPGFLAKAQKKYGYRLIQISTDWVYGGIEGTVYNEGSATSPRNYYSLTKLLGENEIRAVSPDYLILRSEGVFGYDEKGSNIFMRLKNSPGQFPVAIDQFSQPIYAGELATLVMGLLEKGQRGIFNATGKDYVSRYEFCRKVIERFDMKVELKPFSVNDRQIKVPQYLKVDVAKVENVLARHIMSLDDQLSDLEKIGDGFWQK